MQDIPRRQFNRLAGALPLMAAMPTAWSQSNWPTKPVRIVLQFPPGGSTDAVARILSQVFTQSLGQPVLVENRPGADGAIAGDFVARSDPDGHTYFLASNTPMMQVPLLKKNPPYDPIKSFTPVTLVGRYIYVMVVGAQVPVQNAQELLQLIRSQPGKFNYGSYSGVTQLMHTRLKNESKVDLNLVPYKGEGPTINDILGGHVQFTYATPASALPHIREGKLKAMAVLLPKRWETLPQVPTAAEAGVPALTAGTWAALFGPAKLPPDIATRMSRAMAEAIARPDVKERVDRLGFDLASSTPAELAAFMPEQLQAWGKAFADAGLQPE
ncbi:MAG: tripartite tricarboxylate transporter substrate binding protein [Alphaproteobacteria bacterium]|nr:tripartite tricarboxylate transporter substrate binding protein [Alphaproteobacteria bacterium]